MRVPDGLKARFREEIGERFSLRLHAFFLLCGVVLSGLAANHWLHQHGLTSMALRYPAALALSYLVYLLLLRLWATIVLSGINERELGDIERGAEGPAGTARKRGLAKEKDGDRTGGSGLSYLGWLDLGDLSFDMFGLIALASLLLVVIGLMVAAAFLVAEAPLVVTEIAF